MDTDEEDNTKLNMSPNNQAILGVKGEGKKLHQYTSVVIGCLGAVAVGTALAWSAPTLPPLKLNTQTQFDAPVTEGESSLVSSLIAVGAICGALPGGSIADKFGRKPTILALGIPFIISWVLILIAPSVIFLLVARFIAGFATGGLCATLPMFTGEIAEKSIRGALGSFFQMFLTIGILYLYILGLTNYKIIAIGCLIIPILMIILFALFVPETPIYLLKTKRHTKAAKSLRFYRGDAYDIETELNTMQKEIEASSRRKASIKDLFANRANVKALTIALGLMIFQQFSGINTVIFYSNTIFESAGSTLDANISNIIVGIVQVIATGISTILVDKAGRRILLLLSDFVMALCLGVLGFYFFLKERGDDVSSIAIIPLLSVMLFIVVFGFGYGPIPWMMVGELFAPEVKGSAAGIAVGLNWISVFIITLSFGFLTRTFGSAATFWIFSIICLFGTAFTFFLVPETKGKSLAQIQKELSGN